MAIAATMELFPVPFGPITCAHEKYGNKGGRVHHVHVGARVHVAAGVGDKVAQTDAENAPCRVLFSRIALKMIENNVRCVGTLGKVKVGRATDREA